MKMKKTIPALPVQSIKQSCEYYTNKLGFRIRHQEESFAIAVCDEIVIHLWQSCDNSWRWRSLLLFLKPVWSGAESFIAGTASCRVEVECIEELYEEYTKQAVLYGSNTKIGEQYWGHKEFPAIDLDGNLLTFYEVI